MNEPLKLLLCVALPVCGAFLLPVLGRFSRGLRNVFALCLALSSLLFSLWLIPAVFSGINVILRWSLMPGLDFVLYADTMAVFTAATSSLISAVILLYSFAYISHYDNQNEYYCMVVLFLGSMMGIVFSGNLLFLYMFWEITAVCSWRLIGFFRKRDDVMRADKAFLVTAFGALLMLLGFISVFTQTGSMELPVLHAQSGVLLSQASVALILAGVLSKSATLPFQTWLPDAGVAPSPVTALLHAAVLVKIGVYVFARMFISNFDIGAFFHTAILWIAAASAIISACAAMVETDFKRIVAYSTVSQIGFIFFGLASGTVAGITGGLLYVLTHGLAKAGLFLCAGIVEQNTHTKDITRLGGLLKTMPVTGIGFLFCAFSVMGVPPFGGFWSKYLVFAGGMSSGNISVTLVFLVGAFLTILYLFRLFFAVFLGGMNIEAKEGSALMVYSVAILAGLSLVSGVLVNYPLLFLRGVFK